MSAERDDGSAIEELTWTPQMIARFWDYEQRFPKLSFSYLVGGALVDRFAADLRGREAILDYGAGSGYLLEDLLAAGHRCAALEHSAAGVARLRARFDSDPRFLGALRHGDEDISQATAQFDAVFLVEVVEHLYDDVLASVLQDIRRLLRPGGLLIVTTPNEEDRSLGMIMSPESGKMFHRRQHVRSWSQDSLAATLRQQGFSDVRTGTTDFSRSAKALRRHRGIGYRLARLAALAVTAPIAPRRPKPPHLYALASRPAAAPEGR